MYFRKSEVANGVFGHSSGGFCRSAMSDTFLIKGVGLDNDKTGRASLQWKATQLRKTPKGNKITTRPEKKSLKEISICKPVHSEILQVHIVNKTESQKEDNNSDKDTSQKPKTKKVEMNANSYTLESPYSNGLSRGTQRPRLARNNAEPKFYHLHDSYKDSQGVAASYLCIKQIDALDQVGRENKNIKLSLQTAGAEENVTSEKDVGDKTEKEILKQCHSDHTYQIALPASRGTKSESAGNNKSVGIHGKRYSTCGARQLKALNCALSRRSLSVDPFLEDEDFQGIDTEHLLKFKTVSRLSLRCNDSAIEAVAKENSVKTEQFLPPVHGSKWKLKDRYLSELSFNPPTPVLREYTRISQARAVDFSDDGYREPSMYFVK